MPVEDESKPNRTTINVSMEFAEAVTAVAKDDNKTVAEFCDDKYLAALKRQYATVLKRKLQAVTGES